MDQLINRCYFHVDLDAFFASVEQLVHPEYKGKPVIISGNPHQRRNVVSTASYEARAFGVRSAMPAIKAYELCPQGIFIEPHMDLYIEYSEKVMGILSDYSPDIIQLSIDEACLDMTGTERLFGKPEEAALKIKQRVKDETGLTISIGISSNSYLAKICSEIKKPDGLFRIKDGDEENFMSTLPLAKIWGVGEKTRNRLISCGLKTVNDIKVHSLEFLSTILGEASAKFLYNVTRGLEPDGFRSKPKSHSLSNETTYEYDLTDRNAIETSLMELSSVIMTRLLRNNLTSLTVQLKIRYEDFTTVNIQQTYETPVICSKELYERILSLFDRKYEFGRGIRLLGVGVQNAVPVSNIIQPELFENENKKKQTLEKAIIQLEQKDPSIKISKARLISKSSMIFLCAALLFSGTLFKSYAKVPDTVRPSEKDTEIDYTETVSESAKHDPKTKVGHTSLFNFSKDDKEIEFLADGFWNMKLLQQTTATFGYGKDFNISFDLPVFEQEIDLSLWFLLNNCFYVQGAFADKFNKNTIAIGYFSDDVIKEIKASNRNIVFPETYSLSDIGRSIGGGDNQAPGISISLGKDKWMFDAAIRYDMLTQCDKTYYGTNAVTNHKIPKENFLSGAIFVMPDSETVRRISAVYIESSDGSYSDEAGRTYKKISSNDYLILPGQNSLILSSDSQASKKNGIKPCVLIEFDNDADIIMASVLGIYGNSSSPGNGYLGKIQRFFGSNLESVYSSDKAKARVPDVGSFSYGKKSKEKISMPDPSGTHTEGFFISLNSKTMLLAQNSTGFSPFTSSYRYDGGSSEVQDVQVASSSTETKSRFYDAVIAENIETVQKDFMRSKRIYIDVYNPEYTLSSKDLDGHRITYSSPEINFPFADTNPGVYLGYGSSNDDCVMIKSFSKSSRIDIGTKAINGTVTVYKNGIIDSSAKYNPESGEINLSSGVTATDKIYITWFEETEDSRTGMLTGAAGFKYDFLETLSGDIAVGTRWTLNPESKYAEYKRNAGGYTSLSSNITWKEEKLFISNTTGVTLQVDNITGNYRIAGMDNNRPSTSYLIKDASVDLPSSFAPYINMRNSENSDSIELDIINNCSTSHQSGEQDSKISGYKIPISYNFSSKDNPGSQSVLWASNTIITSANKDILSNSSRYNFALKLSDDFIRLANSGESDVTAKIYLQLGVSSESDFKIENKGSIPTWKVFDSSSQDYKDVIVPVSASNTDWQTVSVTLTDSDRALISDNYNARIIITLSKKSSIAPNSGTIYIGPYETISQSLFVSSDKAFSISTNETKQKNHEADLFNKETNYSQSVNWSLEENTVSDSKLIVYKYFDEVDLSSYKNIVLLFAYTSGGEAKNISSFPKLSDDDIPLTIILDRNASNADTNGTKALEVKLHSSTLRPYIDYETLPAGSPSNVHKLEINRITKKVSIDGNQIPDAQVYINSNVIPTRLKLSVDSILKNSSQDPKDDSKLYTKGRFTLDEFYLSENSPKIIIQDKLKTAFSHNGNIISYKNFSILKDASIKANSDFTGTINTDSSFDNKYGLSGDIDASVTVATVKLSTRVGKASDSDHTITSAGHDILTTVPLFNLLSFEENFDQNKDDGTVNKANNISLNFNSLKVPLSLKGSTEISSDSWAVTQEVNDSLNLSLGKDFNYDLTVKTKASQKKSPYRNSVSKISTENYFDSWIESTKYQYSFGDTDASKRNLSGTINNTFTVPFAGFAPQLNFSQSGTYTSTTQNLYSDSTSFETIFPFKFGDQNFSLSYSKTSGLVQNVSKGGDYGTDINTMCRSMNMRDWYFASGPFYDLFSDNLSKKVLKTIPDARKQSSLPEDELAQSVNYNGKYEASWKRPIYANKYDLFIPTIATLSFARDISTAENITDTYQLKATLGYTALNIFSKDGSIPLLKWCYSDEYNFSFQSTLKIPRTEPESLKQLYSTYLQANFYKTQEDVLRTALQFTIQDKNNFNIKGTILYKRNGKFAPFLEIGKLFKKDFDYSGIKITRSDSLSASFYSALADSTNAKKRESQNYEYSHSCDFQIIKQAAITTGITFSFTNTKDEICNANVILEIGGKLNF